MCSVVSFFRFDAGCAVGVRESTTTGEGSLHNRWRSKFLVCGRRRREQCFSLALLGSVQGGEPAVCSLLAGSELLERFPQVAAAVFGEFGFPEDVPAGGGVGGFWGREGTRGGGRGGGPEVVLGRFSGGVGFWGEDWTGDGEDAFDVGLVEGVWLGGFGNVNEVGGFWFDLGVVCGGGGGEEAGGLPFRIVAYVLPHAA